LYIGITLTLTAKETSYSLIDLLTGADIALQFGPAESYADELTIQSASDNTGAIRIGDSLLSTSRCGIELPIGGDSKTYRGHRSIYLRDKYLMAAQDGEKVNVEINRY